MFYLNFNMCNKNQYRKSFMWKLFLYKPVWKSFMLSRHQCLNVSHAVLRWKGKDHIQRSYRRRTLGKLWWTPLQVQKRWVGRNSCKKSLAKRERKDLAVNWPWGSKRKGGIRDEFQSSNLGDCMVSPTEKESTGRRGTVESVTLVAPSGWDGSGE